MYLMAKALMMLSSLYNCKDFIIKGVFGDLDRMRLFCFYHIYIRLIELL
jgi:hypothetical protein